MRLKKALERTLKATRTTGSCRTHGARAGAIMASLSSKFKMVMVFVASIGTEFTGPAGTMRVNRKMTVMTRMTKMMRKKMRKKMRVKAMIQLTSALLSLSMQKKIYSS